MMMFDELGEFYLGNGREIQQRSDAETKRPVLLSAEDLTTHAFIVGMTGSGKTGLAIDLLEEALIDDVPVIAIDPKSDLANIALQFADLQAPEAQKWLGDTPQESAQQRAHWEELRSRSGLTSERIQALDDKLRVRVFTPGRGDALPINTLSMQLPSDASESQLNERANALSVSLLSRIGEYQAGALSASQVYVAQILLTYWSQGENVSLGGLLRAVQSPPFDQVGMLDAAVFFPPDKRHDLMLKLNTLLASPGFEDWLAGPDLDIGECFTMGASQVPVTIFSIAHLDEVDRQFFVSLLLAEVISWMRQQSGSDSLRALLYMDEIYGYIPPVANPPSKSLFLTLLKQARAYGVGLALATQNPVDLDYKALSNIGTWMIGRLQTQQDRARLLDGLRQLDHSEADDESASIEAQIAALKKREFLLHSVHQREQMIFYTRCTQALLVGPMSLAQLQALPNLSQPSQQAQEAKGSIDAASLRAPISSQQAKSTDTGQIEHDADSLRRLETKLSPPTVNPRIEVRFGFAAASMALRRAIGHDNTLRAYLAAQLNIFYQQDEIGLQTYRSHTLLVSTNALGELSWQTARLLTPAETPSWQTDWHEVAKQYEKANMTEFAPLPKALQQLRTYTRSKTVIRKATQALAAIELLHYPNLDMTAEFGESEADFRARVGIAIKANRDLLKRELKQSTAKEIQALADDLTALQLRLDKEKAESLSAKVSSWAKIGGALLSAFLSDKKLSVTNANRASASISSIGRAKKQAQDVANITAKIDALRAQMQAMELALVQRVQQLESEQPNLQAIELTTLTVQPSHTDIDVANTFLAWI